MRASRLTTLSLAAVILGVVLVPAGGAGPAAAAPVAPFTAGGLVDLHSWTADAPEWSTAPTIDGDLAESSWATAATLDGFVTAYSGAPASEPIEYLVGYDADALYLGGTFSDDEAASLAAVQVILGSADSAREHAVATIPVQPTRDFETDWNPAVIPDPSARTDVEADSTIEDGPLDTVVVEMAITWDELGVGAPAAGDEWQLNVVHLHNPGEAPLTSWVPIERSRYMDRDGGLVSFTINLVDQGRWGVLTLDGPVSADRWAVGNAELDFTGLEQKQLTFDEPSSASTDYSLEWKAPGSVWTDLAAPVESNAAARVALEFAHPAVSVDGVYHLRVTADSATTTRVGIVSFDRGDLVDAGHEAQGFVPGPPAAGTTAVVPAAASPAVQAIMDLIPDQNGMRFVGLPEMPELEADGQYTLAPDGQSMIATRTSTVYPNVAYPETHSLTATNRHGDPVTYPYYEDGEGRKYFLSAQLWHLQRLKALDDTLALAATDPLGAARLLYRFAQVSQDYVPTSDQRWYNFPMDYDAGAPYNYWGGIWNSWSVNDFSSLDHLLDAYQAVQQTDALAVLSTELGVDVQAYLLDEMFLPAADYVASFTPSYGNLTYPIWNGLIDLGAILGDPDYVHRAVEWIEVWVENRFLTDGTWYEVTTSYHNQAYKGLVGALASLSGYTDPVGYLSPRTGQRFDDLDLLSQFPVLEAGGDFVGLLVYPDGHTLPLQDTWAANVAANPLFDAGALLLPSAGIARTTSGAGLGQAQTYLQFVPKYGHNHLDPLTISYFDQGEELLPDLGYTHSKYYYFSTSTIGHNTVVVDGADMSVAGSLHGGRIEQFVPDGGPVSIMRASQEGAYAQTSEYSREPWFVTFPGSADGYMLDVFRVEGGERHEYTLNGHAGNNAWFSTDLSLTEYGDRLLPPGVVATEAADSGEKGSAEGHYPGYIYVKDVQEADLSGLDQFTVSVDTFGPGGAEGPVLDITGLLDEGDNELFLGRSPSLTNTRELGRDGDQNDILEDQTMPKLVLRREGTDLSSTFVTLLEAHDGGTAAVVDGADRLDLDSGPDGAVAVQVTYGDTTDIILSNSDSPQTEMTVGDISMTGELGFIRIVAGDIVEMRLVNGVELSKGTAVVTSTGEESGDVIATTRVAAGDAANTLVTDEVVSSSAVGRYIVVTHPDGTARGYLVADVQANGTGSTVVLADEDPGFSILGGGASQLDFYPATQWTGVHTYAISERGALASPVTDAPSTGSITGTVVDASNSPVAGATVSLSGLSTVTTTTDLAGDFTLTGVPTGTRRVVVVATGFVPVVSDSATVTTGSAIIDVALAGELPPVLSSVTPAVGAGSDITATVSKDADLFLVPAGTAKNVTAITDAADTDGTSVLGVLAATPTAVATTSLPHGDYRLYAIDDQDAISVSAGVVIVETEMGDVDDTDDRMVFSSAWRPFTHASHFGGSTQRAEDDGDSVELMFYGSAARIKVQATPGSGIAEVWVDGVSAGTIDTFANPTVYQQTVFDTGKLVEGVHTIRLETTGTARPASWGTFVAFDYIQVLQESELPPVLSGVPAGPFAAGDPIAAQSDEDATLYLVPSATPGDSVSVAAAATTSGDSVVATGGVATSLDSTGLASGRYRVYAVDGDSNLSPASAEIIIVAATGATVQDSSSLLTYSGTWPTISSGSYSGGTIKRAQSSGAWVDIPFYGTSVQVIGGRAGVNGIANVYIDGVLMGTFDSYNATAQYQQVLYSTSGLTLGAHTLRVEASWTKNASATNYYVSFDSLVSAP